MDARRAVAAPKVVPSGLLSRVSANRHYVALVLLAVLSHVCRGTDFSSNLWEFLRALLRKVLGIESWMRNDPFVRLPESQSENPLEDFYSIGDPIAIGAYGKVFEACKRGSSDENAVVVKIIARDRHPLMRSAATARGAFGRRLSASEHVEEETADFRKYMRALLSLKHKNVVRYPVFFTDRTSFYFVMQRCPGVDALQHLMTKNQWYESDGQALSKQMLEALRYIHGRGIMHRDVKLENLMVYPQDSQTVSLQLVDFGLGCNLGEATARGTVGTPGFTAPEVYGRGSYTESADVFSAGVVLYIFLTGRPPFRAPIDMKNIQGHLQSLFDGPDLSSAPFAIISKLGCYLLDRMLLPNPGFRCSAAKALEHQWFSTRPHMKEPVLWQSSASEVHFLKVMGFWEGAAKASGTSATPVKQQQMLKIEERHADGEDEEQEQAELLDDLCANIVHHLPMAVCVADPNMHDCPIVAVSRGFTEVTGFTNEQATGANCRFLNVGRAAEMSAESRAGLRRAVQEETTFLGVVPNLKADGTAFNNLLHLSPLDLGSKTYMVGIQMEVEHPTAFRREEALAVVRKAHGAIRHWVKSTQCGMGAKKMMIDCPSPKSSKLKALGPEGLKDLAG